MKEKGARDEMRASDEWKPFSSVSRRNDEKKIGSRARDPSSIRLMMVTVERHQPTLPKRTIGTCDQDERGRAAMME